MHFVLNGLFISNMPFPIIQVSFHIWKGKEKNNNNYLLPDTLPEQKSKQNKNCLFASSPMDTEPWN